MVPLAGRLPPQEDFDEYHLVKVLGRGSYGVVYLAHDRLLDRPVAIKFLSLTAPERARFLIEARAIARVQHPNVVAVFRVGETGGQPFIVSEYLRGRRLDTLGKALSREELLGVAIGLARGLAAAHRSGVLHRDIKPENAILHESGIVKLLDFGAAKLVPRLAADLPSGAFIDTPQQAAADRTIPTEAPAEEAPPIDGDADATLRRTPPARRTPAARFLEEPAVLTDPGQVIGTPLYLPPELWYGTPASPQSDVYSLGALLYFVAAGIPPHTAVTLQGLAHAATTQDARPLAQVAAIDPQFGAIVDRCLRREPDERFDSADALREALEALGAPQRGAVLPPGNPYRGLDVFEAEHRLLFFGRAGDVRAVIARLRSESFVLVAGDSGVGKSSLCRAGVLPNLDLLDADVDWQVFSMVPGRRPYATLVDLLGRMLDVDQPGMARILEQHLPTIGREIRRRSGPGRGLVLFIDQLEEILTVAYEDERALFAELIGRLAESASSVRVLTTARGDFLTRLATQPHLGDRIDRGLYLLKPLGRDGMREAIVGPARAHGVAFESEALIEELLSSGLGDAGGLPLLQFTLAALWEQRDTAAGVIRRSALQAIGGVAGALERHADSVIERMSPDHRAVARSLLVRMVTREGTRARWSEDELTGRDLAAAGVLRALLAGRLVVAREVKGGTVEIAHEILLRSWRTLRAWLAESAEAEAARERLRAAAAEWDRVGCAREALWRPRQLAELGVAGVAPLDERDSAFVRASRSAAARRRWMRVGAVVAAVATIATVYALVAMQDRRRRAAQVEAQIERGASVLADARAGHARADALRRDAFAALDARDLDGGNRIWGEAVAAAEKAQARYGEAERVLEGALLIDPTRSDVVDRLTATIADRLVVDELLGEEDVVEDDLSRLRLFDTAGTHLAQWLAPARIEVITQPPGADVEFAEYRAGSGGRIETVARGTATAPLDRSLPPGSYLLVLRADGRAEVRYPLVAQRGELLVLELELPPADAIPSGFVYVPPGRFRFGSADSSTTRDHLVAPPQREIRLDAFVIARTETTFGDYLAFLDTLSPEEAERRRPQSGALGPQGSIAVKRAGKTWTITMQPSSESYAAAAGHPIRYRGRAARESQDWRRMPVVGISTDDITAYTAWLDASGRVPGARLCDEREWERVARGADGRAYPHAQRLEPDEANVEGTYPDPAGYGPDEVGAHPPSRSPFGADDMAGNVFEVTRSAFGAIDDVVARGGAFAYHPRASHSALRETLSGPLRDITLGFRVCAGWSGVAP